MELDISHGFLRIVRNRAIDSSSLLTEESSTRVRLYSARDAMKMIEETSSKQWILKVAVLQIQIQRQIQIQIHLYDFEFD